jgi:hypothetical protein
MKRGLALIAIIAAAGLVGCSGGASAPPALGGGDRYAVIAQQWQTGYAQTWHVNLATAQCVWPLTKAAGGWLPTWTKAMQVNPAHVPGLGDCRQ